MRNRAQLFFKIGAVALLVAGFGIYGLFKAWGFLEGPKIIIDEPKSGRVFKNSYINVRGQAKNIASISLNGRRIFIDENGAFSENLLLAMGYNIMQMEAADKFGRSIKEKREIILNNQ